MRGEGRQRKRLQEDNVPLIQVAAALINNFLQWVGGIMLQEIKGILYKAACIIYTYSASCIYTLYNAYYTVRQYCGGVVMGPGL